MGKRNRLGRVLQHLTGCLGKPRKTSKAERRAFLAKSLAGLAGIAATGWTSPFSWQGNADLPSFGPASAGAAESGTTLSAREARELARNLIPFERLTPATQERLWSVVERPTMYRRLPAHTVGCDPDLYLFFLRNPDVIVNMWQLMGATSLSVRRTGAYMFDARDGVGTQAKIELVFGTPDTHVFLADGAYEGPLLKRRTQGRCVMVLKSDYVRDARQRVHVTNQLDAFMQVDQVGAELVVKTLQPVIGKTADHNFGETLLFMSRVSQSLEKNASGVPRLASRLTGVEPEVRDKFVEVATAVNHKTLLRQPPGPSASISDDNDVLPRAAAAPPPTRSAQRNRDPFDDEPTTSDRR